MIMKIIVIKLTRESSMLVSNKERLKESECQTIAIIFLVVKNLNRSEMLLSCFRICCTLCCLLLELS